MEEDDEDSACNVKHGLAISTTTAPGTDASVDNKNEQAVMRSDRSNAEYSTDCESPCAVASSDKSTNAQVAASRIIPGENDVLMGRGGKGCFHSGNEILRNIARFYSPYYMMAKKGDKPAIASVLLESIQSLTPPGRFLRRDASTGKWKEASMAAAREKACQCLRDSVLAMNPEEQNDARNKFSSLKPGKLLAAVEAVRDQALQQALEQQQTQTDHPPAPPFASVGSGGGGKVKKSEKARRNSDDTTDTSASASWPLHQPSSPAIAVATAAQKTMDSGVTITTIGSCKSSLSTSPGRTKRSEPSSATPTRRRNVKAKTSSTLPQSPSSPPQERRRRPRQPKHDKTTATGRTASTQSSHIDPVTQLIPGHSDTINHNERKDGSPISSLSLAFNNTYPCTEEQKTEVTVFSQDYRELNMLSGEACDTVALKRGYSDQLPPANKQGENPSVPGGSVVHSTKGVIQERGDVRPIGDVVAPVGPSPDLGLFLSSHSHLPFAPDSKQLPFQLLPEQNMSMINVRRNDFSVPPPSQQLQLPNPLDSLLLYPEQPRPLQIPALPSHEKVCRTFVDPREKVNEIPLKMLEKNPHISRGELHDASMQVQPGWGGEQKTNDLPFVSEQMREDDDPLFAAALQIGDETSRLPTATKSSAPAPLSDPVIVISMTDFREWESAFGSSGGSGDAASAETTPTSNINKSRQPGNPFSGN